jgi:hypothetical protein
MRLVPWLVAWIGAASAQRRDETQKLFHEETSRSSSLYRGRQLRAKYFIDDVGAEWSAILGLHIARQMKPYAQECENFA